jgi:uncharacterized protein YbjT (DUF2867 family)
MQQSVVSDSSPLGTLDRDRHKAYDLVAIQLLDSALQESEAAPASLDPPKHIPEPPQAYRVPRSFPPLIGSQVPSSVPLSGSFRSFAGLHVSALDFCMSLFQFTRGTNPA